MWRLKNFHVKTVKPFLKKIVIFVDNVCDKFYINRSKKSFELGETQKGHLFLKRGVEKLPYSYKLNKELALIEMKNQNWEDSARYWDVLFLCKNKLSPSDYLKFSESLKRNGEYSQALAVLTKGRMNFPKDKTIIAELAGEAINASDWKKAIFYLEDFFKVCTNTIPAYDKYLDLSNAYMKDGRYNDAERLLLESLNGYSNKHDDTYKLLTELNILKKDWSQAIENINNQTDEHTEEQIKLAMLYQIVGDYQESKRVFRGIDFNQEILEKENDEYRKIIVYDNGESRIEFYKKLEQTDRIIITFDSINMEWQNPPFAFKLLTRQNLDIIAVRKKQKKTYQQDLTQQDFTEIVTPILEGYNDKMAYGFSLGAYHALHLASLVNCRILALSPRLSIHPEFGRIKIIPKYEMKHNLAHTYNENISPIIVYDPKNALDSKYVNDGIKPYFPNSVLIKVPYAGHGIAPHLLKIGILKSFVTSFIEGNIPQYDKKLKGKSNVYFRYLASECLKHNKLNWALHLVNQSLELVPSHKKAIKLKLQVLNQLNKLEEACDFAIKSIDLLPNYLDLRLNLIDNYIELGEFENANKTIRKALKKFGQKKAILKRKKRFKRLSSVKV